MVVSDTGYGGQGGQSVTYWKSMEVGDGDGGQGGQGGQEEGWNPEKKWWVPVAREERAGQCNGQERC